MSEQVRATPWDIVVPLFGKNKGSKEWAFLGTGVFCVKPHILVTADHVISKCNDRIGIQKLGDNSDFHDASIIERKPEADLALLKVKDYTPSISCRLASDEEIVFNQIIFSYEYGTTRSVGKAFKLDPATRMGNVTRILNLKDQYGLAGDSILEISFPALLGASGSPILNIQHEISLWGIIIANAGYHLLPAQIETIHNNEGLVEEEIKYLLPQAIAVNVKHLKEFIDDVAL